MPGPLRLRRRTVLRAGLLSGAFATVGCLSESEDIPQIPLRFERVLNFTESPLEVALSIASTGNGSTDSYTQEVRPISVGPSAEWVVTPESAVDAFSYTSELVIESDQRYTLDHRQRGTQYEGQTLGDHCLTVSWFIRDPVTDVAPLTDVTTNCGPVE